MKLIKSSIIFLLDHPSMLNSLIDDELEMLKECEGDKELTDLVLEKINFFKETGFRKLVFSQKSLDNLENFIIPKEIRVDVLRSLPNRKDIIMLDEFRAIRYIKTDTNLYVFYCEWPFGNMTRGQFEEVKKLSNKELDEKYSDHSRKLYFSVDLITGDITHKFYGMTEEITNKVNENYTLFMKVITYLELTPVTLMVVNGGEKKGDIMRSNLIKNETKLSVIQVNTNWNMRMIRVGSFKVRGHWRWQPCGKNFSQLKLIYIDMFEKGLMKRLSQKELQN